MKPPYQHQVTALELLKDQTAFALLMEQGTGKTKVIIDDNSRLLQEGKINACLVLAPNGVHTNWAKKELQDHCTIPFIPFVYNSSKMTSAREVRRLKNFMEETATPDAIKYLCMNIEALRTKKGLYTATKFLENNDVCMVVDESTIIKSYKSDQAKICVKIGLLAKYRRILTGTPITQSPLDIWMQFKFLNPRILPFLNYTAFKSTFARIVLKQFGNRSFESIEGYQNLDRLTNLIKPYSFRVLKKECLDLPEKIYQRRYVPLTTEQAKAYSELRTIALTLLSGDNALVTATTPLSLLTKLQCITSGFVKPDSEVAPKRLSSDKPDAVIKVWEESNNPKTVVYCHYIDNVKRMSELLTYYKIPFVTYSGMDSCPSNRAAAIKSFQEDPKIRFFLCTNAAARGITLTSGTLMIYYANSFSLETRLQSEDRIHRIGQKENCLYVDLIAEDTVDEKILEVLTAKKDISTMVLSDLINLI